MPVRSGDSVADFRKTATAVPLWDVACQRRVEITGPDGWRLACYRTPRDLSCMGAGACRDMPLVDERGGMVSDPVLLRLRRRLAVARRFPPPCGSFFAGDARAGCITSTCRPRLSADTGPVDLPCDGPEMVLRMEGTGERRPVRVVERTLVHRAPDGRILPRFALPPP